MQMPLASARASVEHDLKNNPAAQLTLQCDQCGFENRYSYEMILSLTAEASRPRPLEPGQVWAIILAELPTEDTMEQRGFFGERVLVERKKEVGKNWAGFLAKPTIDTFGHVNVIASSTT